MGLEGRVAAVVGAGSAIGRACVRRLRADGATVVTIDDEPWVPQEGDGATGVGDHLIVDVRSEAGARALEERCRTQWGRLDVLFYAVSAIDAVNKRSPTEIPARSDWERVFESNAWGPTVYARTLLPMLAETKGSIIFLSSIDGLLGNPNIPLFSMSKGALAILTHVLAHDAAAHGVRVNAVATAAISQFKPTDPGPALGAGSFDRVVAATPLQKAPTPENIAGVVSFFASDDSEYVTGTVLPVDGGRTAITPGTLARGG